MSTYIAIDLKSFYASVECRERGLDPLNTNLVVADESRTQKTICLAVSPSLKAYGIPGRPRLFEVVQKINAANYERQKKTPERRFSGKSYYRKDLKNDPSLAIDYIIAKPRMALYIDYSTQIYDIYLKYIAREDIHVYSIDEVMMDVTGYLNTYGCTARELAELIIQDVFKSTKITATAGIGTNLYLCKVAMDIVAKHTEPDEHGVRIAELNEYTYREKLWNHRPLTDFWRIGRGYARQLESIGLYTMGDIARCSLGKDTNYYNEDLLFDMFGVNAELLIDHAWGYEPCTMEQIKAYKPFSNSIGSGQVLHCPYDAEKAKLVTKEMTELLVLELVEKDFVTDQVVLTVGYDIENLQRKDVKYTGDVKNDRYGRKIPKHAHGTCNLPKKTSSTKLITECMMSLYNDIVNPALFVRRITISFGHVISEKDALAEPAFEQMNLFTDYTGVMEERKKERKAEEKERRLQEAMLEIKSKYGKNSILKGMNLLDGATAKDRNNQIGGHKA